MNGTAPPLILRRRGGRRVVVRLRLRLGAIACRQRPHILGRWKGGHCFISFLFTGVGPVRVLGHDRVLGHGPVLGVVVVVDLDWRFGWTCGAPKDALSHLRRPW